MSNTWPVGNIQKWEDDGARLESAITTYLESCLALENSPSTPPPGIDNLSTRLERRIEYFHTLLAQPLAQSLSSLARTRNSLVTAIYRIPQEILAKIFEFSINNVDYKQVTSINIAMGDICRTLYAIAGVSSAWRKVVLAHSALWTLVPSCYRRTFRGSSRERSAMLSLQRSGSLTLQLAVDLESHTYMDPVFRQMLIESSSRFDYVNIRVESTFSLEIILKSLLENSTPKSLTQLSLCIEAAPDAHTGPRPGYIFESEPRYRVAFESIMTSLRVLRLRSIRFRFVNLNFKNLVELRIQDLEFGHDSALTSFLLTLGPESPLRTLEVISVTSYANTGNISSGNHSPLSFPNLQSLYLEDLYLNVVLTVLRSTAPGSYRLVITPKDEYSFILTRRGRLSTDTNAFKNAVKDHKIDTLMLGQFFSCPTLGPLILSLLRSMPTLTTLHFDDQILDRDALGALTRPYDDSAGPAYPRLTKLIISRSIIDDIADQTAFKTMISSHPLQELVIGGYFREVLDMGSTDIDLEMVDID